MLQLKLHPTLEVQIARSARGSHYNKGAHKSVVDGSVADQILLDGQPRIRSLGPLSIPSCKPGYALFTIWVADDLHLLPVDRHRGSLHIGPRLQYDGGDVFRRHLNSPLAGYFRVDARVRPMLLKAVHSKPA